SKEHLSMEEAVNVAKSVGGVDHGFRFIQMPYNASFLEAYSLRNQEIAGKGLCTPLEAAGRLGLGVFASVPLMQGRLLPQSARSDDAKKAERLTQLLQLVRSSPSIVAALVGQKRAEHVAENLTIAKIPPLKHGELEALVAQLVHGQ